jgi:uncharacterized protein (DUF2062 family)
VYPLELLEFVNCRAGRYGFETEIITRAGWAGARVREVPVSCTYQSKIERVSHFRPWRDSFRAVGMHARLMARAIAPWPHAKWIVGDVAPSRAAGQNMPPAWRRVIDWLHPVRAWRELRDQRVGAQEMAAGVAIGVFIGNLPLFGVHTLLSLYAARRLHLHPLPVVAGSHVSTPPVGPVLIAAAIGVGHCLLHGSWLRMPQWQATWRGWAGLFGSLMLEWSLGAVIVGFVLAVAAYVVSHAILSRTARM